MVQFNLNYFPRLCYNTKIFTVLETINVFEIVSQIHNIFQEFEKQVKHCNGLKLITHSFLNEQWP